MKNLMIKVYHTSTIIKILIQILISALAIFIFTYRLNMPGISLAIAAILWISLRISMLIFIKDEVIKTEEMDKKTYESDIKYSLIGIIIFVAIIIYKIAS